LPDPVKKRLQNIVNSDICYASQSLRASRTTAAFYPAEQPIGPKIQKETIPAINIGYSRHVFQKSNNERRSLMKRYSVLIALVLGMLMISLAANQSVSAQDTKVALGLGVGAAPDYEGSDDYQAVPIPYVNVIWSNHMSINLLGNKAKVNLIPSPIWKGGLIGEYIPERDDVDNDRVDRMETVDTAVMLGGFFGFQYENWSASIEAMSDVADGNDGSIIRLNGGYNIPIDQTWNLSLGVFSTWADDDYMEAYFGIDAADSARSGLSTFDADSGIKDVGLNLAATFKPWEQWGFMGLASYKRLLDDAEDSPVVDDEGDENQFSVGVLVFYRF